MRDGRGRLRRLEVDIPHERALGLVGRLDQEHQVSALLVAQQLGKALAQLCPALVQVVAAGVGPPAPDLDALVSGLVGC